MIWTKNKRYLIGAVLFFLSFVLFVNLFLFNSKVYFKILQPKSSAGRTYYFSMAEKDRISNPKNDILVIGDSRIEVGFSAENSNNKTKKLNFINAGIAGTASRVWYYLLREIDPHADRYKAIILTFSSFSDRNTLNYNDVDDIRYLIPLVGLPEIPEIALSYDTNLNKAETAFSLLLKGFALKGDIVEFLQNPIKRLDTVKKYDVVEETKNNTGLISNLKGLYYDSGKNCIIFPNDIPEREKSYISNDFSNPFNNILSYNIRYNQRWLNKIIEFYKNSDTIIILAKIPCVPLFTGKQNLKHDESSSLLDIAIKNIKKVIIFPDNLFDFLEKPEYFADHIHLNCSGRELFSELMASATVDYLMPVAANRNSDN